MQTPTGALTTYAGSSIQAGGANVSLEARNAVTLGGTVTTSGFGTIDVDSTNSTTQMVGATSVLNAGSGSVSLTAQGDVTPTNLIAGSATIESRAGNILGDANPSTDIQATTLTLKATGTTGQIGTSGSRIDTDAGTLIATASNGVFVSDAGDITLGDINGGSGEVGVAAAAASQWGRTSSCNPRGRSRSMRGPSGSITMANTAGITANAGALITLDAHDVAVTNIQNLSGTVTITTTGGDIEDVASGPPIRASTLNLNAQGGNIRPWATSTSMSTI